MEPSIEVALIILLVVVFHFLIFYILTRKKKNICGKLISSCHNQLELNQNVHNFFTILQENMLS